MTGKNTMARAKDSSRLQWAAKVAALIAGGNTAAAISQIKVAPSVKDLRQLQTSLASAARTPVQRSLDLVIAEQLDALAAPRLHRSP